MDTIEFRLSALRYNGDKIPTAVADIYINGLTLWENFFKEHASIPVAELYENLSAKYKVGSVPIIGCSDADCSAIYISVEVGADAVTWKDFVLPHTHATKSVGEFVFDREQYFREVDKLKRWSETDSACIEYGGIAGGEITLVVTKGAQAFNFYFDENLDDPLPALVRFFNAVRNGNDFSEANIMRDDGHVDFKISFNPWTDGRIKFCVDLVWEKIIFYEIYRREELAAMLKRIFDALLNDKYFPYSYPLFDIRFDNDSDEDIVDALAMDHPDWAFGDVLNYAFTDGQQKISPPLENYLSTYKKMLTEYVVPEGWCRMDEKFLIDELVHCTEPKRIIELVKTLVPDANDRTAELYARWTEYAPDDFVDKVMDEPNDFKRMQLIAERFPYLDSQKWEEISRQLPYTPLTEEQRLYRRRQLRDDAPKTPENKYLADEKFSAEDWENMPDEVYYMIRAMRWNPDLDPESAARLVAETIAKISPVERKEKSDKKISRHLPNEYALDFVIETSYFVRMNVLLNLCTNADESDDDLSDYFLTNLRSIADPNFDIKSLILTEGHFSALCEAEKNS